MNLTEKIKKNTEELKADGIIKPYMDDRYYCLTCNNVGKCHPETSLCFICGDDNWEVVKGKENDLGR